MSNNLKLKTHDYRKLLPQVYGVKPGPAIIQELPPLKYIQQNMTTSFDRTWIGHPNPIQEEYIGWKIVNQLKRISKDRLDLKFTLMPYEMIWHGKNNDEQETVSILMQVPEWITLEMVEEAKASVEKNLRKSIPTIELISEQPLLCIQKLHVGHYRDTDRTLSDIQNYAEEKGYSFEDYHKKIYLTPSMRCHAPDSWNTIVRVNIQK
jgi:hypothetical protein